MSETSLYVPVLKSKRGEYLSLRYLGYSCFRSITPLIDISPPAQRRKKDSKPAAFSAQIKHHAKEIAECWRVAGMPIFIDAHLMPNSEQAMKALFGLLKNHHLVPTSGPLRSGSYNKVVSEIVKEHAERGACYRIPGSALYHSDTDGDLENFIALCELQPSAMDIIIDLESVDKELSDESLMALIGRMNTIQHLRELRSLTLIGGSFPVDLTGTPSGKSARKRLEWKLWQRLLASNKLLRRPRYGDYGIQNPTLSDVGFLGRANLRYTNTDEWIVFRGSNRIDQRTTTKNLSAEMKNLCKLAAQCADVKDSGFSWGDEYIRSCANAETPANDAPKWKAVGFNHHMTYVVHQLRAAV